MSSPIIKSTLPVFDVLRRIANADAPVSTADLSRQMKLPTSTVHRFLGTLEEAGYIARYLGSAKFIPGNMAQHLSRALFNRFPLGRLSTPYLRRLAVLSNETVTLTVRIDGVGLRIEAIGDADQMVEIAGPRTLAPLHAGLEGWAILAFLPDAEIETYRNRYPRHARSHPEAYADLPPTFWRDLRRFRALGFACAPVDFAPGHAALALPVRDTGGNTLASIGIIGPAVKSSLRRASSQIADWMGVRDELEAAIGAEPGRAADPFAQLDTDALLPPAHIRRDTRRR